jgi:hypothetical protein
MESKSKETLRSEDEELVLEFCDRRISSKYCLILKEYDGKGAFLMKFRSQDDIRGLYEIVHLLKPKQLFYPHTVRDVIARYVVRI